MELELWSHQGTLVKSSSLSTKAISTSPHTRYLFLMVCVRATRDDKKKGFYFLRAATEDKYCTNLPDLGWFRFFLTKADFWW
jgi:hypothetical protein